jgi:predicted Rossmann-fold nucleotide-binding protein
MTATNDPDEQGVGECAREPDRPTIVAVFGRTWRTGRTGGISDEVLKELLKLARCAGSKIAAAKFVVLTGDRPPTGGRLEQLHAVKDAAMLGAAPNGHWIGVLKGGLKEVKEDSEPAFRKEGKGKGGVIFSNMGDRRNFLEASLADAAIVLDGKTGTISEAVSAISLGKPVLLVGTAWATRCPALHQLFKVKVLTGNPKDILIKEARKKLGEKTEQGPMRDLIEQALKPRSIQLHERSRLVAADGMPACLDIASWLTEIQGLPQKGEFPPLDEPYSQAGVGYPQWLEGLLPPKPCGDR